MTPGGCDANQSETIFKNPKKNIDFYLDFLM